MMMATQHYFEIAGNMTSAKRYRLVPLEVSARPAKWAVITQVPDKSC